MNSKERAKAAFRRQEVDMVPLGLYVVDYDTIEKVIGRKTLVRNKVDSQIALWEGRRDELAECMKRDVLEFYQKLDIVDIITFKEAHVLPPKSYTPLMPKKIDDVTYELPDGRIYKASYESNQITCIHNPKAQELPLEPSSYPIPDYSKSDDTDESCFEVCDFILDKLGKDRYILGNSPGIQCMPLLGGMQNGLMMYGLYPEYMQEYIQAISKQLNKRDEAYIRKGVDGVMLEQDMGGTNGPLISPTQWENTCFPAMKSRVESVKRNVSEVVLHCCGNTIPIMDMIADSGINCYQSLQTFAGMLPGRLCKEYGDRLAFWGGLPLELLITGEPDDIRKAVRETMESTKMYPGYIMGPSHSIAKGTKYDNLMAGLDEFQKLRSKL